MKKYISVIFVLCIVLVFSPTFAEVTPALAEKSSELTYEVLGARFSYLCSKWDVDWDINNYSIVEIKDNRIVVDDDGVMISLDMDKSSEALNVTQVSIDLGIHTEYNTYMKVMVLVGVLEYDMPITKSQQHELLNEVLDVLSGAMDTLQNRLSMMYTEADEKNRIPILPEMSNCYYWKINSDGLAFEVDITDVD